MTSQTSVNVLTRLHNWLSKARQGSYPDQTPAYQALSAEFGYQDHGQLDDTISQFIVSIQSHKDATRTMPTATPDPYRDLHIEHIESLRAHLLLVRGMDWRDFKRAFTQEFLNMMLALSMGSSIPQTENPIEDATLVGLREDVVELINKITASAIEEELKKLLIVGLDAVGMSLWRYYVSGAEGIRSSVDTNFATWARYREQLKETEDQEVVGEAWNFLIRVDELVVTKALRHLPAVIRSMHQLMIGNGQ